MSYDSDITVDYNVRHSSRIYVPRWKVPQRGEERLEGWYPLGVLQFNGPQHTSCGSYAASIVTSHFSIWARLCPRKVGPAYVGIGRKFQTSMR